MTIVSGDKKITTYDLHNFRHEFEQFLIYSPVKPPPVKNQIILKNCWYISSIVQSGR